MYQNARWRMKRIQYLRPKIKLKKNEISMAEDGACCEDV